MADAEDSKSFGGNLMWVQLPPPAVLVISGGEATFHYINQRSLRLNGFGGAGHR